MCLMLLLISDPAKAQPSLFLLLFMNSYYITNNQTVRPSTMFGITGGMDRECCAALHNAM